jgi:mRNA capping enzyme, catalytic domain
VDDKGRLVGGYSTTRFHTDTLLDGEIVLDRLKDETERLKFLVFDAMVVDKKSLLRRNLSTRIGVSLAPGNALT